MFIFLRGTKGYYTINARNFIRKLMEELGLDTIWQPPWDEIRIGQITVFFSLLVFLLHVRLNNSHQVTEVTVEKFDSSDVLEVVAVVKYGVKTVQGQGITETCFDL